MNKTEKRAILSKVDESKDRVQDKPEKSMAWDNVTAGAFPYEHPRGLPSDIAQEAIKYIKAIVQPYPFQLRYTMALPLWDRFAQTWCETGDAKRAMKEI